jgi:hypothetical protein
MEIAIAVVVPWILYRITLQIGKTVNLGRVWNIIRIHYCRARDKEIITSFDRQMKLFDEGCKRIESVLGKNTPGT